MTLLDLAGFLLGRAEAIRKAAAARSTLALGALLVLSAAVAREYDGVYLPRQPVHLALPFAASLLTSSLLFGLVCVMQWIVKRRPPWLAGYPRFLALYWLTAPLAWFYAIPVERFLSPVGAMQANLWLLALVAAWRVALMARILHIVYGLSGRQATALVLWFGSALALVVLYFTPIPIFNVMGGIRHTPEEQMLQSTAVFVGIASAVVWALSSLVLMMGAAFDAQPWAQLPNPTRWGISAWAAGLLALAVGAAALPLTQPEQRHRYQAEQLLRANRVDEGLAYLSGLKRRDFPPHWNPPPRIGYGERSPDLVEVLLRSVDLPAKDWVRKIYLEKFETQIEGRYLLEARGPNSDRVIEVLEKLPERDELIRRHAERFREFVGGLKHVDVQLAKRARELVVSAGVRVDPLD